MLLKMKVKAWRSDVSDVSPCEICGSLKKGRVGAIKGIYSYRYILYGTNKLRGPSFGGGVRVVRAPRFGGQYYGP